MALGCAVGCGGGDDDKLVRELSDAEANDLCEFVNDNMGEATTCTIDGEEFPYEPMEINCANANVDDVPAGCDVTVGEYKDCVEDIESDVCAEELPPSCSTLFSEACMGEDARIAPIAARWPHLFQSRI